MKDYKLTVGLEIHAELNTRTKMFCGSKNDPDEKRPNVNICPICMGHPGTLPSINKEAVKSVLRLGIAINGKIADYTEFDRKNYFYPDIPKGYQISQYKHPLVQGGELAGVKITRIHLEEDTARSSHDKAVHSLVDFNRAGVPLLELVTEPVIKDPETASRFAKELQLVLNYLGIAEANMEKGEMRVEANISVSSGDKLGTKVEVKNLNSFKAVEKAIIYERNRQIEILERGENVIQETRGFDENTGETFSQRAKEDSHDYRYFPDPDLPKLFINEIPDFSPEVLRKTLPELPSQKRDRYKKTYNLKDTDIEIYIRSLNWSNFFEAVANKQSDNNLIILSSNYITSELKKEIDVNEFCEVIKMIGDGEISSKGAKEILKELQMRGGNARSIAIEKNVIQISDHITLTQWVEEVIKEENKDAPIQYLVGQVIKKSQGKANPKIVFEIMTQKKV